MNFDITAIPTTIDAAHVGLAALAVLFLILYLTKGTSEPAAPTTAAPEPKPQPRQEPKPEPAPAPKIREATPDAALQLLSLLQQEARFVDFIQEDLAGFSDADIGAAARVVHEGSRKALNEYFTLSPVRSEDEESRVTLPEGFNAHEVRLTGNVVGKAPFTGTLVHRGWKVTDVKLPKLTEGHDTRVIAPAEVEL